MMAKFYITTAIDYVNAAPHLGHAYEKILADAIARWHRLLEEDVFFLTGTDENAQKNVKAAKEAGIPVKKFIDKNTKTFIELCKKLNLSNDDFIRTTETRHAVVVQQIFKTIQDKGDIYKADYEGLYCTGCEAFLTEKDLVDEKCPEHCKKPEILKEESYFFKLGKYREKIIEHIKKNPGFIEPTSRRNEILERLKEPLKDLSVSRCTIEWGIPCPTDASHRIYVWIDALVNYISGIDYPSEKFKKYWPADVHIIGKGINWFHSVIWPALLLSAGIKLPKKVFVHGYLTVNGQKISKSLGNVIDPIFLIEKYGTDALRYFLMRDIPSATDGDFSEIALKERFNNELANKLGNLVSRVSALAEKYGIKKTENKLLDKLKLKKIEELMEKIEIDKALDEIFAFIDVCNQYVQDKKPWETQDSRVLYELADSIKAVAILLWPFIPEACEKIAEQFGFELKFSEIKKPIKESKIKKGEILFQKIK
ncbi:methionine--tRNA ligase [Candidatus Pacearchaeota archaeon]|nr:methionine--tRNA ligase [Candidatus Pacearchaeota archaeon]